MDDPFTSPNISRIVIEQRPEEFQSQRSLYCDQGDSEGSQSDFLHPFQYDKAKLNRLVKLREQYFRSHIQQSRTRTVYPQSNQLPEIQPTPMPIIQQSPYEEYQKPTAVTAPSSPAESLQTKHNLRYKRYKNDEEIQGYSEFSNRHNLNAVKTLQTSTEEEPRHSSYGPRVKRYLSSSRTKERGFQPGNTVSKFTVAHKSYKGSSLGKTTKLQREKPKVLPPLSLQKLIQRYIDPQSPLFLQATSLCSTLRTTLLPTFSSYPFPLNFLSPFPTLKSSLTKYISTVLCPPPSHPTPLSLQIPPQKLTQFFMKYQPRYKIMKNSTLVNQTGLAIKRYRNCVYFGGVSEEGRKEGYGVVVYFKNQMLFQGRWRGDQRVHGLESGKGQIYVGGFVAGQRDDQQGMLLTKDRIYYGEFRKNLWVDNGLTLSDSSGLCSLSPTLCLLKTPNSDLFVGHLHPSNLLKHSLGFEFFSNGDAYLGNYQLSKPEHYGEYYWATGANYKGNFMAGRRHGYGVWEIKGGDRYEGEYVNDRKCGEGVYWWGNGCWYRGQFEADLRHGYGEMGVGGGRVVRGLWVDGVHKDRQYLETKKEEERHERAKTVSINAKQQIEHIRMNKATYKKARISKSMQIKLQKQSYQKSTKNQQLPFIIERVYAEDQY